uniref:Uncharacterized protein n=1 Tax=viral metagenome TaxID=1070528 RepID=A0A6C0LDG6_9ZZZZ
MSTYENISEEEKIEIEKGMDDKLEILKKLKQICLMLKEYDLDYDEVWNEYYKLMIQKLLLDTPNTEKTPWGLRNKDLYRNYNSLMEDYEKISENPPTYYGNKLYQSGALEDFINMYATNEEIKKRYPKLKDHILTLVSDYKAEILKNKWEKEKAEEEGQGGGKRKSKGKGKKVSKKPVVSQKKESIYKEILGKQMKIYKMPDSRKEYVKYKGELLHISDYKDLMKQKAIAKTKTKVTKETKATQQKAIEKTKTKTKETKATQQKAKAIAKSKTKK